MSEIKLKLKPFMTPNFVIIQDERIAKREDGFNSDNKSLALKDVPRETLIEMCDQFKEEVLRKAGY